jgi:hypothetical protein
VFQDLFHGDGRVGFTAMEGARFRNRYYALGHSGYFLDKDGKSNDDFMRERWIPLLTTNDPIEPHDERPKLTVWRGLQEVIFKNFEPVTHPEPNPTPSGLDLASMRDAFLKSSHELNCFIMVIVGNRTDKLALWVSIHDGRHFRRLRELR